MCDDRISVDMIPWHVDPVPVDIQNISCSTGLLCLDLNSDDNSLPGGITYPLALTAGRTYVLYFDLGGIVCPGGCQPSFFDTRNISVAFSTIVSSGVAPSPYYSQPFSLPTPAVNASGPLCLKWVTNQVKFLAQTDAILLALKSTTPSCRCGPQIDNVRAYWKDCLDGSLPPFDNQQLWDVACEDGWVVTPVGPPAPLSANGSIVVNVRCMQWYMH